MRIRDLKHNFAYVHVRHYVDDCSLGVYNSIAASKRKPKEWCIDEDHKQ